MKIILASSSPRRKEILIERDIEFKIIEPDIKEMDYIDCGPYETVMSLAFEKAYNVSRKLEDEIVLAADTIIFHKNQKLGKPKDKKDAYEMLKSLSGSNHSVITGYALIKSNTNKKIIDYTETKVIFKELAEDEILSYIETGEPMDKAGSYAIQSGGKSFIKDIVGSYHNVVGLPIEEIEENLRNYF